MEFVSIDVETANANMASICQIGMAKFRAGSLVGEWKSYVNPETYFDPLNVSIHGIAEDTVATSPRLPSIAPEIESRLGGQVVVSHTHFDRVSIHQAFRRHELQNPQCTWLDSARVARRTWKQCASSGYGLHDVCALIGYEFRHHDALEDAKAAGQVLLAAIDATGLSVEDWIRRVEQPIDPEASSSGNAIARAGNPLGPFFGEVMAFTGALQFLRREAADLASEIGFDVGAGVTRKTTMLVVGDQDIQRLAGHTKSAKHRKAEELIAEGQSLRILQESDFKELVLVVRRGRPDHGHT